MKKDQDRMTADLVAKGDSLTENIKKIRLQQINELQDSMENLYNSAQQELAKKQQTFQGPLMEKIQKAIQSVCEESGYAYVLDFQAISAFGSTAIDATDKVKAKLGIK